MSHAWIVSMRYNVKTEDGIELFFAAAAAIGINSNNII